MRILAFAARRINRNIIIIIIIIIIVASSQSTMALTNTTTSGHTNQWDTDSTWGLPISFL